MEYQRPSFRKLQLVFWFGLSVYGFAFVAVADAQIKNYSTLSERDGGYVIPLHKSGVIQISKPIKRISVANPGIADILILSNRQIYVVGKTLGSTNVVLWNSKGRITSSFDLEVSHDLETLKQKLHLLLPDEQIKVYSAQENILLSGQVSNLVKMNAAYELASSFLPECIAPESQLTPQGGQAARAGSSKDCKEGQVLNTMEVGGVQQIMLEITVAEISRTVLKGLEGKVDFLTFNGNHAAAIFSGGASSFATPFLSNIASGSGAAYSFFDGNNLFRAALEISKTNGLAKILAEPTLTTLTGQEATFLSGGEFPIPVPQGGDGNSVTIEFKEFGIGVRFLPVVLDSGRINLKTNISVSELAADLPVVFQVEDTNASFIIPSLTKRSVTGTVELADGQTIGMAGLISDNVRSNVEKLPGLGDLPILGALFRSQQFQSGQTELVIFVTPHLARPISRDQIKLPTDNFVPPSDFDFYMMGRLEAKEKKKPRRVVHDTEVEIVEVNEFGHQL